MSKERELLKKVLATGWLDHTLSCEVEAILAQPEQTETELYATPQKREPLTRQQISEGNQSMFNVTREAFVKGVKWAEQQHGIGGGE